MADINSYGYNLNRKDQADLNRVDQPDIKFELPLSELNQAIPNDSIGMDKLGVWRGQVSYDSGVGFWLGLDDGTPKLSIGNSAGNKMTWDGTTLSVTGTLTATAGVIGGWTIGATTLSSGTNNIILDSSNKAISINDATFGNQGIQLQYNAGTPRAYIGDGATQFLEFDGTNVNIGGNLSVSTVPGFPSDTNLISYWSLDEGAGTLAVDEQGIANGTLTGNPTYVSGVSGAGVECDGTGDYIDCSTGTGTALGNSVTAVSVSLWFKADGTTALNSLFTMGDFASSEGEITLKIQSDTIIAQMNNAAFSQSSAFTDTASWHHLALVYDGTNGKAYLDGAEIISAAYTAGLDLSGLKTIIGGYYSSSFTFDGSIDEVRIYDSAITLNQVKALNAYPSGPARKNLLDAYIPDLPSDDLLIGHWTFDEGTGSVAIDSTTNANSGAIVGAVYETGVSGTRLDFDGAAGDYVRITDHATLQNQWDGGATFCVWLNADSDGGSNAGRFLTKDAGGNGWSLLVNAEAAGKVKIALSYRFSGAAALWTTTSTELTLGQDDFLAISYNPDSTANDPIFYLNGAVLAITENTAPSGTRTSDVGNDLYIGAYNTTDNTFDGGIDEPKWYSSILTANNIKALYASPSGVTQSGVKQLGGQYTTATSGARMLFNPTDGFLVTSAIQNVFQAKTTGADVGDVIMGDETTTKFVQWDESASKLLINGIDPAVDGFGGDGSDGILNVTSGTTNIAIQKWQYTSVNVASGAILSTTGTSGVMRILCQQDMTVTGDINFNDKITDSTVATAFNLLGGDTFTPTGKYNGHGGGGGGATDGNTGGAGGPGDGGGAGGAGGANGGTPGAGGAATGGSLTQGAGGDGVGGGVAQAGGDSAGGGGSGNNPSGGGAGNPGGAGDGGGSSGGTGFGTDGGAAAGTNGAGGGGGGGKGGYGGVDTLINVGGEFDGTSGTINTAGGNATAGGDGGAGASAGGGGGGGGDGADAGKIRLIWGTAYTAATYTQTAGALGAGGTGGTGGVQAGSNGSPGTNGSASSNTIKQIENLY